MPNGNPQFERRDPQRSLIVERACRLIESSETAPNLASLAHQVGLSPFHFQRLFKSMTGVTPKQYASALRAENMRNHLSSSASVTSAIYGSGFVSSGTFYAHTDEHLGMTPTEYRSGGANQTIRFAIGECTLGSILVAASQRGICSILLGDDADSLVREVQDRFQRSEMVGDDAEFAEWIARVVALIETPALGLDLPLDVRGTAFQHRVWNALRKIPAGSTVTYSELARRIGSPRAVRAVASACAANMLAVAIPCHRVVRSDGSLSGYRWSVARKEALLAREAQKSVRVADPSFELMTDPTAIHTLRK